MSDLDILLPDQVVTIAGKELTIRELTFAQTLRLSQAMAPIIDMLADLCESDEVSPTLMEAALCAQPDAWISFMAQASGQSVAWVESLSDTDGRALQMLTLERNRRFFVQRLLLAVELRKRQQAPSSTSSTDLPAGMAQTLSSSASGSPSDRSSASTLPSSDASTISAPT